MSAVQSSGWTEAHVRRLFWRAGFGATPAEAGRWARAGRAATLDWVVDGDGRGPLLSGPPPTVDGKALDPVNEWGHDVLWWMDRMIRSRRPLVEKLTLFWHDHFATADQETPAMLRQNRLLRRHALGNVRVLLGEITRDPAMLFFLSLVDSDKDAPNENYPRELMELFTLGSGYTEEDIRQIARALTGFRARYRNNEFDRIEFDAKRHDGGVKRIFGKRGRFGVDDTLDLVTAHPRHAPFLVGALWDFFVATPPSPPTLRALASTYRRSGLHIRPVVRQILSHPALYANLDAPDMVKSPVVYIAGALRTTQTGIRRQDPVWLSESMGQLLFHPPSVAGWEWGPAWMSSNAMRVRFSFGNYMLERSARVRVEERRDSDASLTPAQALQRALDATGRPWISAATRRTLLAMAAHFFTRLPDDADHADQRAERARMLQQSLRHLLITGPDAHLH